jgi:aspartyl-tRNA(Asn)/glutamyl-tRNA(Gln) amidotransferase subunit A
LRRRSPLWNLCTGPKGRDGEISQLIVRMASENRECRIMGALTISGMRLVEEIEVDLRASADIIFAVTPPAFYALFGSRLAEFAEKLDPTCRSVIERGASGLAHTYQAALMQRTALFRQVQRLFESYDFLVTPTLSAPALPATHKAFDELTIGNVAAGTPRYSWYPYTHPFNVTGHPALSVPVGWSREELPIGLQIVGPWHGEDRMISVAALLEKLRPWADRRPIVAAY